MYKNIIEGKKAIFFDLDGTVVDTTEYMNEAVQKVMDSLGFGWISGENYYQLGKCCATQWKSIIKSNSLDIKDTIELLVEKTHDEYIKIIEKSDLKPKEGFWDFVYELKFEKDLKLVLTTNSEKKIAEAVLEKIEATKLFDLYIYGDDVKKKKPNPQMYKVAAKKISVKPKEVTVFEDSIPGSLAAKKAKMDKVIIWNESIPKYKFKGNILYFLNSFLGLAGNLDDTYIEALKKASEGYHAVKTG